MSIFVFEGKADFFHNSRQFRYRTQFARSLFDGLFLFVNQLHSPSHRGAVSMIQRRWFSD
jgi:hypothetical protein